MTNFYDKEGRKVNCVRKNDVFICVKSRSKNESIFCKATRRKYVERTRFGGRIINSLAPFNFHAYAPFANFGDILIDKGADVIHGFHRKNC